MRKVVANTTPLIAFSDIGELEILHKLYGEIYIPTAVLYEIESEPAKSMVAESEWIKKFEIRDTKRKDLFKARLHAGEIEAIILADEMKADLVIMDDNTAKKTAKFLGMKVTGSLGVLVKAKESGIIDAVSPYLKALIEEGLYVDRKTRKLVLEAAGEAE